MRIIQPKAKESYFLMLRTRIVCPRKTRKRVKNNEVTVDSEPTLCPSFGVQCMTWIPNDKF